MINLKNCERRRKNYLKKNEHDFLNYYIIYLLEKKFFTLYKNIENLCQLIRICYVFNFCQINLISVPGSTWKLQKSYYRKLMNHEIEAS